MKIKLLKLKLQNFKGIKDLEIDFKDDVTNIFGANATGKTTIFDAYSWLLFNKDSLNNTNFNIKTIDKNGETIRNIEHIVEGTFLFNNKEMTFRKEYKEDWGTKRGSSEETFRGNTTDHFVNGAPKGATEYKKIISSVVDEETFKLISNPRHFSVDLDKKKRREILLAISDEVLDEEIIKVNKDIKNLDLENYTIEELQAMNKATYKKADKEIKELPVRIDELYKSIKDIDFETLEFNNIPSIEQIDKEISLGDNTGALKAINEKMSELITEQIELKNEIDEKNRNNRASVEAKNREIEEKRNELQRGIGTLKKDIEFRESQITEYKESVKRLATEYEDIANQYYEGSDICPICNQKLPAEMKKEALEKYNTEKSNKLEKIVIKANKLKDEIENFEEGKKLLQSNLERYELDLTDLERIDKIEYRSVPYPERVGEIDEEIADLKERRKNAESSKNNDELLEKKSKLQTELDEINSKLAYKEVNENAEKKIKEYETRQKELAKIILEAEKILNLCDEYIKIKSELISTEINKKFNFVEFKLFEKQVNGGINEVYVMRQ
ncbi:AAA family ATPase [Anaerosphaera multitolerans]|uniref:Nuclease SbcCD subunit C n=1 Tax=Anaerosphaera multitolerans TaxID=2487351 RepID=A0A437S790_9FIRM|nr:ATP-binding protein [Anaerosphaera multitolerans]RVU54862.1 hypothetical protein EF514_04555 [Anaerosphaera multitolerans]